MRSTWLLACFLLVTACGSGDDGGADDACQGVDVAFPEFTPAQAQDGESVTVTFTIKEGTPTTACRARVELDCGGQKTSYIVGASQNGISANLIVHCDQATAPVDCSYTYEYPQGSPNQGGLGAGPTCTP